MNHSTPVPCPSPTLWVHSNPCPLSQWCHPTISSSVIPFSSRLQFFPASGSFPMSQLFASGGQSIGASALASDLPVNIQGWFPLGLTGLICLLSKGFSRVFANTTLWMWLHYMKIVMSTFWKFSHPCWLWWSKWPCWGEEIHKAKNGRWLLNRTEAPELRATRDWIPPSQASDETSALADTLIAACMI